ncbi:ABC-2 type transport system ATP-binding protein [Anaeroplasma bactoclasticum]|uniref:ABC-2 type transport system ATP-binding protein n=2 Tax=Anaeroplasma bactoclasticum TaxID=2088 RepID=A0A397S5Y9_9MOLU|nr:ABC-2 type transport system ATP-binding protein [Anaeroplasma bactoclasticum]
MIEIINVCKSYDEPVLENINFIIENGSIFGLIGINGAGKTTFLNMISGVMGVDSGEILYDGMHVYENIDVKKDIFFLPDEPFYTMNTTPLNLVNTYKVFYKIDIEAYYKYLKLFKLPIDSSMYNFSKGMKRQVFVSLALAIKPKYLFLDETFDGLDPLARLTLKRELIKLVEEKNTTVVISSHSLRELADICDSYGIINKHDVLSYGNLDELMYKYHKYTMAFDRILEEKDFDFPIVKFNRENKIISIVTTLDYEEMKDKVSLLDPIDLEESPLDFEEEFMIEVKNQGVERWGSIF